MNITEKLKNIGKQIGVILLYFIISLIMAFLLKDLVSNSNKFYQSIANILDYLVLLVCFIFLFRKIIVPDFYDFKKNGKKYLKDTYQYYIYGFIIMFISNIIITSFIGMATNETVNRSEFFSLPIASSLAFVVFAPIIEELMTRVVLKDTFNNKWIYILLSGFIFGFLHVIFAQNINELFFIIPYGALGATFAYIYNKTDNVWTNIFYHAFHNFICILVLL